MVKPKSRIEDWLFCNACWTNFPIDDNPYDYCPICGEMLGIEEIEVSDIVAEERAGYGEGD